MFAAVFSLVSGALPVWSQASVPGETAGQTLLWRETFAGAVIEPESPGSLTAVDGGRMLGGLPNGPTWLEGGVEVSWSASIRNRLPAESGTNVTIFNGYRNIPEVAASRGMAAIWIRPTLRQNMRPGGFFHLDRSDSATPTGIPMASLSDGTIALATSSSVISSLMSNQAVDPSLYRILQPDEWVQLWFVYDPSIGVELWMKSSAQSAPDFVGTLVAPGTRTIRAVRIRSVGVANQGGFAGRVGPVSLYAITSVAAGRLAPGGFRWPTNAPTVWRVRLDPTLHNLGTRSIGGFQQLVDALRQNVILGREAIAWTDADGLPAGYSTIPTAADKRAWWLEWEKGRRIPMGDRVEFDPGIHRGNSLPLSNYGGIQFALAPGSAAYSAEIRMSQQLTAGWSQPDPARPRVWRYDGPPLLRRHVWGRDWQSFQVYFTTAGTEAAITALQGRPWAAHTDATGTTYISLPDGISPSDIGPLEGSNGGGFSWTGAWLGLLLIQGSAMYNHTSGSADQANANYALGVNTRPAITIIEARGLRCGKHPAAFVGNSAEGLCIWYQTDVGFDPPGRAPNDPAGFGVGTGAFTPLVDYSSASTTVQNPGRIVTIYDGVTYREPTEPGDGTTVARSARRAMYYAHGTSGNAKMFALTVVRDPWPTMFSTNPDVPNLPTAPGQNHVAFEVFWREDRLEDWLERRGLPVPTSPEEFQEKLLEYAFDLPSGGTFSSRPEISVDGSGLSFSVDTRKGDLTWEIEHSSDLLAWNPLATSSDGINWLMNPGSANNWSLLAVMPRPVVGVNRILRCQLSSLLPVVNSRFFRVRVAKDLSSP